MLFGYTGQDACLRSILSEDFGLTDENINFLLNNGVTVNGKKYWLSDEEEKDNDKKVIELLESKFKIYAGWYYDKTGMTASSEEFILIPKDGGTARYITR